MKKLASLTAMIMIALMSFTFVGCDEDDEIADILWGTWEGNMYVEVDYHGTVYKAARSVIQFDKDYYDYTSGTGYWIDYYSRAPWDYYASHIEWRVVNGRIQIYSLEDDTYFEIYDYSLSGNHFRGIIDSEWGDPMEFDLRKTASPYWDDFEWGYHYYSGYRSKNKAAELNVPFDSNADVKPVRRIGKRAE